MKKLLLLTVLTGIAIVLKAQQKLSEKFRFSPFPFQDSTALKPYFHPQNRIKPLLSPPENQLQLKNNDLIASLDHMPIVKPVGKWNMPIAKPDASLKYTMPVKRLPPIVENPSKIKKINPKPVDPGYRFYP